MSSTLEQWKAEAENNLANCGCSKGLVPVCEIPSGEWRSEICEECSDASRIIALIEVVEAYQKRMHYVLPLVNFGKGSFVASRQTRRRLDAALKRLEE